MLRFGFHATRRLSEQQEHDVVHAISNKCGLPFARTSIPGFDLNA
jgi:hypothetical protein